MPPTPQSSSSRHDRHPMTPRASRTRSRTRGQHGLRYSAGEDEFLVKNYARKGRRWCSDKLGRTVGSIDQRAKRLGLAFADVPGFVRTTDIAQIAGTTAAAVWLIAKRHGVLRLAGDTRKGSSAGNRVALVPEGWAEWYLGRRESWREAEGIPTYLTTDEVLDLLPIGRGTLMRALIGESRLAEAFQGVRRVRAHNDSYLLNPHDVARLERDLRKAREKAARMVSLKEVAVEYGLNRSTVITRARRAGIEIHEALVGGRWMLFVPRGSGAVIAGLEPRDEVAA